MEVKFSLVVCTLGRYNELERLFDSFAKQTYSNFEVILVDQNNEGFFDDIVEKYSEEFLLKHIRSEKGLSKSRNVGLKHVKGDIIAFPDDDCWYPEGLLKKVAFFFEENSAIDGITSVTKDKEGNESVQNYSNKEGLISTKDVWFKGNSTTIFIKASKIKKLNYWFDENLGVGAGTKWGGCEETDFLIRLINKGANILYKPDFFVFHPQLAITNKEKYILRNKSYSLGTGYTLRKNDFSIFFIIYFLIRPILGWGLSILQLDFFKAKERFVRAKGIFRGWLNI